MQVIINLEDYASIGTTENLVVTAVAVFVGLWIYQLVAFILYTIIGGKICGPMKYRTILARHTMDLTSMVIFCFMGFQGLSNLGGFTEAAHSLLLESGKVATVGAERAFVFSSASQRLCVWQIAYEAKNFCDSVIHNDGVLFLVHHTFTGLLAMLCLRPFLHVYAAYFLGCSEVSTAFLCALACFDVKRGVAPLAENFPLLMKAIGITFAALFVIFRVILWPYYCYYFWLDSLELLSSGTAHSLPVLYIFMIVNSGLTFLQIFWLKEIYDTAIKVFSGDGELTIQRGEEKKKA